MQEFFDRFMPIVISSLLMGLLVLAYDKFKNRQKKEEKRSKNKNGCLITFLILIGLIFAAVIGLVIYAVNSR